MLVSREKATERIGGVLLSILLDKQCQSELIKYIEEKYRMPSGELMDYISGRVDIGTISADRLFAVADGIDNVLGKDIVKKTFSDIEIANYSKADLGPERVKFPVVIPAVKISEDQWIGKCDSKFLMRLFNSQLINYNENTQRVLQRVVRKGNSYYKISVNKKAVGAIASLMRRHEFISNTITLNMPMDGTAFSYDSDSSCLIINKINMFDIVDGYHRLLAISIVSSEDRDFNMPFELRITYFDETKAKQFIYQEDQKTKMHKVDSDSLNTYNPYNRIVEMLNNDMNFIARGEVNRSGGIINAARLATVIQHFYHVEGNEMKFILATEKDVRDKLNVVFADFPELLNNELTLKQMAIIFCCIESGADVKMYIAKEDDVEIGEQRLTNKAISQIRNLIKGG